MRVNSYIRTTLHSLYAFHILELRDSLAYGTLRLNYLLTAGNFG